MSTVIDIPEDGGRMVHDTIHGTFYLPGVAWDIIDTPEFQRLRYNRQTGNAYFVYPGSEHTRFQHCLGVAHLCLQFGEQIRARYPNLMTERHALLLCLAGLCHDLGHGPWSHLYDTRVIRIFEPESTFKHEEASFRILELLWRRETNIGSSLSDSDITLIGKMIFGSPKKVPASLQERLVWTPWDNEHSFLFEVVSNERTGIDADKFDYLKRDSHYSNIPCTFDPQRLMAFFYIGEESHLSYHHKADEIIMSMWNARDDLHRRVYQHRVAKCIDLMTVEMFRLCADVKVNAVVPLRQAHLDLSAYCTMTDTSMLALISRVPEAKRILDQIYRRELWRSICSVSCTDARNFVFSDPDFVHALAEFKGEHRYYIYHKTGVYDAGVFFRELITQARGASIDLRDGAGPHSS